MSGSRVKQCVGCNMSCQKPSVPLHMAESWCLSGSRPIFAEKEPRRFSLIAFAAGSESVKQCCCAIKSEHEARVLWGARDFIEVDYPPQIGSLVLGLVVSAAQDS